jgi:Chalcone isomerase like
MFRRLLISTLPRQSRPPLSHYPNLKKSPKSLLRPLALGVTALAFSTAVSLVYLDSDTSRGNETTVGRSVLITVILLTKLPPVDPATSIEFPTILRIPSKGTLPEFTLIGVGVRVVSFLKIKVYSVAFYADLSNPNLKVIA